MAGLGVNDLPWPAAEYRADIHDPFFESKQKTVTEDVLRAKALRSHAFRYWDKDGIDALGLASRIDPTRTEEPLSVASARHMRDARIRFSGAAWKLHAEEGPTVRFDIIKPKWARTPHSLFRQNAADMLNGLRSDVLRSAPGPLSGFLIAVYHNELDPNAQLFQPHAHILASQDYVSALDGLRSRPLYQPTPRVRTPIRARRTITNPAHAFTYLLKSYWTQRPALPIGANGNLKRPRQGQRLDEPYHSQSMLWLDRCRLGQLVLLMGLRVGKCGFEVLRP